MPKMRVRGHMRKVKGGKKVRVKGHLRKKPYGKKKKRRRRR